MKQVPVIKLTSVERKWLENIYRRNLAGERFSCHEVWSELYGKIPDDFHPSQMNPLLVCREGEKLALLGLVALQRNKTALTKSNKIIGVIKKMLIENPDKKDIDLHEVADTTGIPHPDVSLLMQLSHEYAGLYGGASSKKNTLCYDSVSIEADGRIFYNYLNFQGMETLITRKIKERAHQSENYFTIYEQFTVKNQIDLLRSELSQMQEYEYLLQSGQQFLYEEVMTEMEEMKNHFSLTKKSWLQFLRGKVAELFASGLIDEIIIKRIAAYLNPAVDQVIRLFHKL